MGSPPLCCVEGCPSQSGNDKKVLLYNFPNKIQYGNLRRRWTDALRLANVVDSSWEPKRYSKLCSNHFIGNRWSNDESEPSSVPTIFPTMQLQIAFTPGASDEDSSLEEVNFDKGKPVSSYVVDVDDDDDDESEDEVIEETSDCLFVIDKKEVESAAKVPAKSRGSAIGRRQTAVKNPARKAPASRKRKKASKANGKSALATKKVKHVKILAESSDEDSDYAPPIDDTCNDEVPIAALQDELKVQFGPAPKRVFRRSWSPVILDKASEELPRAPMSDKMTQVALPGNCEGFIFSTDREDDFNIGVECNIFYEFVRIPELKRRRNPNSRKKIDHPQPGLD